MRRIARGTLLTVLGTLGMALVWRVLRAGSAADAAARLGEEEAARGAPFPPDIAAPDLAAPSADAVTEQVGVVGPPASALPLAAVPVGPGQNVAALPIAIVAGAGGFAAADAVERSVVSVEQADAAARKRGLRVRGRHYGLKVVAATIGATVLVLAGGAFLAMKLLMGGGGETTDAGEDLAVLTPGAGGAATTLAPGETLPVDTTGTGGTSDAAATSGESAGGGGGEAAGGGGEGATATLRPADGTYSYAGSGTFETKVLGFSGKTSPRSVVPGTVAAAAAGCWTLRLDIQDDKSEVKTYCNPGPGILTSPGDKQMQKQFGMSIVSTITCTEPRIYATPGMQPGQTWTEECSIRNSGVISSESSTKGPRTYVGTETVAVGGQQLPAYHFHTSVTLSGKDVSGPSTTDDWYSTPNGLLLRSVRRQRLTGFASFNEDSEYVLKSVNPG